MGNGSEPYWLVERRARKCVLNLLTADALQSCKPIS